MLRKQLVSSARRGYAATATAARVVPSLSSSVPGARAISSSSASNATPSPSPNDAFANGTNAYYAEEMYRRWHADNTSVHASWDAYFSGLEHGLPSAQAFQPPPGLIDVPSAVDGAPALHVGAGGSRELTDHLKVRSLGSFYFE